MAATGVLLPARRGDLIFFSILIISHTARKIIIKRSHINYSTKPYKH